MKKIILILFSLFFTSILPAYAQVAIPAETISIPPSQGSAIHSMPIYYPPPPTQGIQNFLGEDQSYTVTMRGNGETVITMKSILTNVQSDSMTDTTLTFPSSVHPQGIIAFQVIQTPSCIQYQQLSPIEQKTLQQPVAQSTDNQVPLYQLPPCLQWQQPDFNNLNTNTTSYQHIPFELKNNSMTLHFPTSITSNQSGSYFISFRTFGYTKKDLTGAYSFTFETLKVNDKIGNLDIGINTDADYTLSDASGKVQYQTSQSHTRLPMATAEMGTITNAQINDFYTQIGQGTITKTASDLQANESYTVKGSYADAQWKLYSTQILVAGIVLLFILIGIIITIRIIVKKLRKYHEDAAAQDKNIQSVPAYSSHTFLMAAGWSLAGTFIAFLFTVGLFILSTVLQSSIYDVSTNIVLLLLLFAISLAIYLFLLFTPAVVIGIKKGSNWAIATFACTIGWSLLFMVLAIIIYTIFFGNRNTYTNGGIQPLQGMAHSKNLLKGSLPGV